MQSPLFDHLFVSDARGKVSGDRFPIHIGIMMVLNLCIGLCTPPVGSVLFVGISVAKTTIEKVIRPLLPLYIAMIIALLLVTFIPELSLWLPGLFGL